MTDSHGLTEISATVDLTVSATPPNLAIYEPFDYLAGALNGKSGLSEVGLASTWNAYATATVVAGSLSNGALPVAGGSIGGLGGGSNNFGGARAVSASALLGKGLLADDATLWFSVVMDAASITAADFGNAGSAAISIGTVIESSPGVFTIRVTPTSAGTLQLKVNAGAVLKDIEANALVTTSPIADDTTFGINVADAYAAWAGVAAFDADANNDGVANGMAWLLGATNPSTTASGFLPRPGNESGKLVLTFRCLKTANRGSAVLRVQYTNDLGQADPWTSHQAQVPDADGTDGSVVFDTTADADPAFINVRAEIPASAAPTGKLFGRLHATGLKN